MTDQELVCQRCQLMNAIVICIIDNRDKNIKFALGILIVKTRHEVINTAIGFEVGFKVV